MNNRGLAFVGNIFGDDVTGVSVRSQFGLRIDAEGTWIRPDIFLTFSMADGSRRHAIVECKYGDDLDETKKKYSDYFAA